MVPGTRGSRTFQVRASGQNLSPIFFFFLPVKNKEAQFIICTSLICLLGSSASALITAICSHMTLKQHVLNIQYLHLRLWLSGWFHTRKFILCPFFFKSFGEICSSICATRVIRLLSLLFIHLPGVFWRQAGCWNKFFFVFVYFLHTRKGNALLRWRKQLTRC